MSRVLGARLDSTRLDSLDSAERRSSLRTYLLRTSTGSVLETSQMALPNPASRIGEGSSLVSRGDDELAPSWPPPMLLRVLTAAVPVLAEKSERRDRRERWCWRPALLAVSLLALVPVPFWLPSLLRVLVRVADCLKRRGREDVRRLSVDLRDLNDLMLDCPFTFILVMTARRSVLGLLGAVLHAPCSGSAQAGLIVVVVAESKCSKDQLRST